MNGYQADNRALQTDQDTAVGASQTDYAVSKAWGLTAGGSKHLAVAIDASSASGTVIAKLQEAVGTTWRDVSGKTVSITGAGRFYIRVNAYLDSSICPLLQNARIVVTTAGASAASISAVYVMQEL